MARHSSILIATSMAALVLAGAAAASPLEPASWTGDVRFLRAAIDSIHPRPYLRHDRAEWDSAAADVERRLPALRYDQAVGALSRFVALLGDGHSRLGHLELADHAVPTLASLPGPGFQAAYPVDFAVFSDGLRIVRAEPRFAALLGWRVSGIGGEPTARAVDRLAPLIPADNAMWVLHVLPAFLRCPGYLAAAGLIPGPAAPLRLTLVGVGGRVREAVVPAEAPDTTARWIEADAGVRVPPPLSARLPGPFAFADLADSARTVFVRIRRIVDEPGREPLARFAERLFAHVDSLGCRRLVLDLRGNGGGNNYLNQPLVLGILRRPQLDRTGRLFVVVDRGTFSAAMSLAADLERETHGLFVGEPTGGAPNSPGDPARVTLPASRLVVRISTVLWQGSDPRDPRPFIAPDLPVAVSWADWIGHRDPALEAIASYRPPETDHVPPNTHWGSPGKLRARAPTIAW